MPLFRCTTYSDSRNWIGLVGFGPGISGYDGIERREVAAGGSRHLSSTYIYRREPQENGESRVVLLGRRHYLHRVTVTDHRLALTRLICGSFLFRGQRSDPSAHSRDTLLCRKCGVDWETPGHVFMMCGAQETVEARRELDAVLRLSGKCLFRPLSRDAAVIQLQSLIFDWNLVVPTARFVYRVVRSWGGFGRRLPTMVCEVAPDTDEDDGVGWDCETATEDGSERQGSDMEIDL